MMMLAACSGNYDTPSGDTPVPTESYETVLNYFKEINAVPRPSRHEDKMRAYLREFAKARGLRPASVRPAASCWPSICPIRQKP